MTYITLAKSIYYLELLEVQLGSDIRGGEKWGMSFIKMFAEEELGNINELKGSFHGTIDENFLYLILSDNSLYLVEEQNFADSSYDIIEKVSINDVEKVEPISERRLVIHLKNGKKHIFDTTIKAKTVINNINQIIHH